MHSVLPWYWAIGAFIFMMAVNSFMLVQYWEQKGNNNFITAISTAAGSALGAAALHLGFGWTGFAIITALGFLAGLRPIREWIKFLVPHGLGLWPSLIPSQADGPEVAEGGAAAYNTSLKGPARAGEKWLNFAVDAKGKAEFSGVYQRAKRGMEISAFSIPSVIAGSIIMFIIHPGAGALSAIAFYAANILYISTILWAF